jgi:glycosyltransferase involved in cell wall biosynthesis
MKISWQSNAPWAKSGYGNQTALFTPRLKALGHDVAIQAWWGLEGSPLHWNGIPVYPKGKQQYGLDVLAAHSAHWKADITLTLLDAWVYQPEPELNKGFDKMRWCPWFPVDMEPIPPIIVKKVVQAWQPIVYSLSAAKEAARVGLDVRYVPHGVDTKVYQPGDRKAAREVLKVPDDLYLVGMVAANTGTPSRKAFEPNLRAFRDFHRAHPNSLLYLHTVMDTTNQGLNLIELCEVLGLQPGKDVIWCDQYMNLLGFPDEYMAHVYNALDVLLSVTMGEGFGIPILEAQACGTPVVVGDWTAMAELCWYGTKVPKRDADPWFTMLASYQFQPRAGAIAAALEETYRTCSLRYRPAEVSGYDADVVTERHWKPLLDELAARVEAEQGEAVAA